MSKIITSAVNAIIDFSIKNHIITGKQEAKNINNLKVSPPTDSKTEKTLDALSSAINIASTESTAGTLLAPASILSGLWSLGRAQNVKGRKAAFKAMAMDAALDYVWLRNGKVPPLDDFPTLTQAAVGQGILGKGAALNATFHNKSERKLFNKEYTDTILTLTRAYRTPEGRKAIKKLVNEYDAWKKAHPSKSSHAFFLER